MMTSSLGPRGLRVSRLSLGTVQFGLDYGLTKRKSQAEVDSLLDTAAEVGCTLLDTAPSYGDGERLVGDYFRRRPNHPFQVATKVAKLSRDDVASVSRMRAALEASLRSSAEALGSLAVVQLHQAEGWLLGSTELWRCVDGLRRDGFFRSFGVSVYEPEDALTLLTSAPPALDVIQVPFNVLDQRFRSVLQAASAKGIGILARSAFLKGVLTANTDALPPFLAALRPSRDRLSRLAARVGMTAGEAALAFVAGEEGVSSVLVGVDRPGEIRRNAALMDRLEALAPVRAELLTMALEDRSLTDPRLWAARGF